MKISPLKLGSKITCLPVVHGSADCAHAVRRRMLEGDFDCLAVALPESFRASVLEAIQLLPTPSMVLQRSLPNYGKSWDDDSEDDSSSDTSVAWSYVPIDPCQPVIMGLRFAMEERLAVKFIDLETNEFQPQSTVLPDPYALKTVSLERFATAVLPSIMRPFIDQEKQRIRYMAWKLRQLEHQYDNIVLVCSIQKWPWLREAYAEFRGEPPEHDVSNRPQFTASIRIRCCLCSVSCRSSRVCMNRREHSWKTTRT